MKSVKMRLKQSIGILLSVLMTMTMIPILPVAAATNNQFQDVQDSDWYYDSVEYVNNNGLMYGTSETTFEPQTTMSRAMIVTVLHRMEKEPTAEPATFKDVPGNTWFTNAVAWAAANGIVNGYNPDTFAPNDNVSREQIATILYRYAEKKGYDVSRRGDLSGYSDNDDISDWANDALEWANAEELINGYPDNTIIPGGNATRAEVATILMRFCESVVKPGTVEPVEKTFTVTFDYNYDNKGTFKTVEVKEGETVGTVAQPARSGYSFSGWYTETEKGEKFNTGKTAVSEDLTLYAQWKKISSGGGGGPSTPESSEEQQSEEGFLYSLTGLKVQNDKVFVNISTIEACDLIISISDDEDKKQIKEIHEPVDAALEMATASVNLPEDLPEYYIIHAVLKDYSGTELCNPISTISQTKTYEDYMAKSTYDFDEDLVINFDEDLEDNFGVLSEDVKLTKARACEETEKGYVFTGSDDRLKSIQNGDVISVTLEDGEIVLLRVKEVSINNDKVIIVRDEDASIDDFYQYIQADMIIKSDPSDLIVEPAEGVTCENVYLENDAELQGIDLIDIDDSFGKKKHFALPTLSLPNDESNNRIEFRAEYDFEISIEIHIHYDIKLFKRDYLEFEIKPTTTSEITITGEFIQSAFSKATGGEDEFLVGEIVVPTEIPGLHFDTELSIPLKLMINAGLDTKLECENITEISYNTDDGVNKNTGKKFEWHKLEFEGGFEFNCGVKIGEYISFLTDVFEAGIYAKGTYNLLGEIDNDLTDSIIIKEDPLEQHLCKLCFDVDSYIEFAVGAEINVELTEKLSGTIFDGQFVNWKSKKKKGYISVDLHRYGSGECPNKGYRVKFICRDSENQKEIDKFTVSIEGIDKIIVPGESVYLPTGKYKAIVSSPIGKATRDFEVKKDATEVSCAIVNERSLTITGRVVDSRTGEPIRHNGSYIVNATNKNGNTEKLSWGTDADGRFSVVVPDRNGPYTLEISNIWNGYTKQNDTEVIDNITLDPIGPTDIGTIELYKNGADEGPDYGSGTIDLGPANVGDYVTFGHYEQDNNLENGKEPIEWKVLDKKDGRALLLSKYGLDAKPYHETEADVTWENCTLRSWLNNSFLEEAFSTSEQSAIPTVTLSNPDNPILGTEGGNDTQDRIFLLSLQEMQHCFNLTDKWTDYDGIEYDLTDAENCLGGSKEVITSPTTYSKAQGAKISTFCHDAEGKETCWWWLRSPGFGMEAAFVYGYGHVDLYGNSVNNDDLAVRPALWVNLAS